MSEISNWLLRIASWRAVVGMFILTGALITLMTTIFMPAVTNATGGLEPFDIIFPLSTEQISAGLAQYNSEAIKAYLLFTAVDVAFPIASGLFSCLLGAWLIKISGFEWLISLAKRGYILLLFIPTVFDLIENAGFVTLILSGSDTNVTLASATTFVHAAKFRSISVMWAAHSILFLSAIIGTIQRTRQQSKLDAE